MVKNMCWNHSLLIFGFLSRIYDRNVFRDCNKVFSCLICQWRQLKYSHFSTVCVKVLALRLYWKILCFRLSLVILSFACPLVKAQQIIFQSDAVASRGFMSQDYWQPQHLSIQNTDVKAYADQYFRFQVPTRAVNLFFEKRTIASFFGNRNSLVLGANKNTPFDAGAEGRFDIKAQFKSFEFSAVGLTIESKANDNIRWTLQPKFISLNKFAAGSGNGTYINQYGKQTLGGSISQEGMSSYGFKREVYPLVLGNGFAVDANIVVSVGQSIWTIQSINLISEIPGNDIFFSNDSYQVSKTGRRFDFLDKPPVTGTYGQKSQSFTLPKIILPSFSYHFLDTKISGKIGFISVDGQAFPWLGIGYQVGPMKTEAIAYDSEVLQLSIELTNWGVSGLHLKLTTSFDLHGKNQISLSSLVYTF